MRLFEVLEYRAISFIQDVVSQIISRMEMEAVAVACYTDILPDTFHNLVCTKKIPIKRI